MIRRKFTRREILGTVGGLAVLPLPAQEEKADFTLHIGPASVELAPKKVIRTTGYNGMSPGPLLRVREGQTFAVDVYNDTDTPELAHWHGLHSSAEVDGSMEEGTPMVAPRSHRRYTVNATPSGLRWYHTHIGAKRNLNRGLYSGQFGFLYVQPSSEPGDYDQEIFLAFREWDPYFSTMEDDSLDVAYKAYSVNDRSLGSGEPIRVKPGQKIMLRMLNASASLHRRIGFSGHSFDVRALDGNPVPRPTRVQAIELGPAERAEAIVEMNQPGVWILGAAEDGARNKGMGVVVEYAGQTGAPRWVAPGADAWDYTAFGTLLDSGSGASQPDERRVLTFEKKFAGHRWFDNWTVNGKSYPKTDPIHIQKDHRYRLILDNRSDEAHPLHLHRHSFELVKIGPTATAGVWKDVVVAPAMTKVEVNLTASHPGPTLFHCHNQTHMDYGFMTMFEYM